MNSDANDSELQELLDEVRRIEVLSRRLVKDLISGGYSSAFRGSGIEFDEVREYVPGDDPRSVDWNVTARAGKPYVKKYVDEREVTLLFVVDLSASMTRAGFGAWSGRQMAARLCACLGFSAVANDDKVGLIAFSDGIDAHVRPAKGRGHVLRIVRDCLVLSSSERATTDMTAALEYVAKVERRRVVLFLVSDFLGLDERWFDALMRCRERHDVVGVRLLGPELEAPSRGAGMIRMRDPERAGRGRVIDWRSRAVRDEYLARVAGWRSNTERMFRRAGVDCMDVPIPPSSEIDAIVRPIVKFFRMREARGGKR